MLNDTHGSWRYGIFAVDLGSIPPFEQEEFESARARAAFAQLPSLILGEKRFETHCCVQACSGL